MPTTLRRLMRYVLVPALALASACENSLSIEPDVLAGNYTATSFVVTQTGQSAVDVLAKGGSLSINIAADSTTTGLLSLPAGVLSPTGGTADMTGRITRLSDGSFKFTQSANSFINQLTWQQFTDALVSTSFLSNTQFQITLRK
jgi:hypothetical protein